MTTAGKKGNRVRYVIYFTSTSSEDKARTIGAIRVYLRQHFILARRWSDDNEFSRISQGQMVVNMRTGGENEADGKENKKSIMISHDAFMLQQILW